MDILDTFGDWVQLLLCIGFMLTINQAVIAFTRAIFPMNYIYTFGLYYLLWSQVYDYDIVIGFLVGGILSLIMNAALWGRLNKDRRWLPEEQKPWNNDWRLSGHLLAGVMVAIIIIGIMITKMVMFW